MKAGWIIPFGGGGGVGSAVLRPIASALQLGHRYYLDGYVADFGEEAIENRAAEQDVEARARRLTEDDVSDALLLGEGDERVGYALVL